MNKRTRVMVMGAGGTAGINFIECLRMAKGEYYIIGCDINKWHIQLPNVDKRYVVPYSTEPGYIEAVNDIIEKEKIDFIHAQPDMEVEVLSASREKVCAAHLFPAKETVRICRDKMTTNEILRQKGVPAPISFQINSVDALRELIQRISRSSLQEKVWIRAIKGAGSKAALPVRTFRQAKEWIHYWRKTKLLESRDFMICEFLPKKEYAFQSLWQDGRLVVSQARERLEYLMGNLFPSGQSSSPSVAVTVHNKKVNEIAAKAVLAIDPGATGVFCVDLKENSEEIPCVTEINCGRFFTTSNFFAALGCNMPHYYVKMGLGKLPPDLPRYNAVPHGYYWIRSVDMPPLLIKGEFERFDVG
jgi:glutathione synthase/RimK-type ligase-like ATP-grasp enzyme